MYPSQSVLSAKATGSHPNPMISFTLVLTSHKDSYNDFILCCQEDVSQDSPLTYCCHDALILTLIPKLSAICKKFDADVVLICRLNLSLCPPSKKNSSICCCWHRFGQPGLGAH